MALTVARPPARPAEIELLLACARREMRDVDIARARTAAGAGVDWARVVALGHAHHLLPLIHAHIARGALDVPGDAREDIAARATANARRSLMLASELLAVLALLDAEGIVAVPLKGPVLADRVYGAVSLRRMLDLDLLVAPRDLPIAMAALERRGYRLQLPLPPDQDRLMRRWSHHVSLLPPSGRFRLEMHDAFLPRTGGRHYELDMIASRLEPASFMGTRVLALAPEDLFVYLCQHGAAHAWSRLEWLATVAELRRSGVVRDTGRVAAMAGLVRGGDRVTAATALIADLLDVDAPRVAGLAPRLARANAAVVDRLARDPERTRATSAETAQYQGLTDSDRWSRLRRAIVLLLEPQVSDVRAVPLPRVLWPLYYFLRPARLLARSLVAPYRGRSASVD